MRIIRISKYKTPYDNRFGFSKSYSYSKPNNLLGYDLLIKTKNLSKEEINLIEEIEKKLKN